VPGTTNDAVPGDTLPFDDEASLYANWKWFKFEHLDDIVNDMSVS
jgi:hypothetical protein